MELLYPALPIAVVLGIFTLLAKHALDMRTKQNYREMWGALSLALLPAAVFWLIVVSGGSSMVERNILLMPVGALVGAVVYAWAGYVYHDIMTKTQPAGGSPSNGDKPPIVSPIGDGSTNTAIGKQGIAAGSIGTVIINPPKEQPPTREALFNAQLQEVLELQKFIGGKDEFALRELFDLRTILNGNLALNKAQLLGAKNDVEQLNITFAGGEEFWFPNAINCIQDPVTLQTKCTPRPGRIGIMKKTIKYKYNRQVLERYVSSVQIPEEILSEVKTFLSAIDTTISIMFLTINEFYSQDRNYITSFDDAGSKYNSAIQNNVWKRIDLKSKVDKIIAETRKYLNVHGH
jgi:hypothetical protein